MSIIIIQEKKYNVINKDSFVLFKNKAVFWALLDGSNALQLTWSDEPKK